MEHSESIVNLAKALAAFHAEVTNPVKDKIAEIRSDKGNYAYGFSDLADATNLARPILAKNGLSVVQELLTEIPGKVGARSMLLHASGEFIVFEPCWVSYSGGPQQEGSAATYARRYSYLACLSLAPDDDDAAGAQKDFDDKRNPEPPKPEPVQESTLAALRTMRSELDVSDDVYGEQLEKVGGVSMDTALSQVSAKALIGVYSRRLKKIEEDAAKAAQADEANAPEPTEEIQEF